jgi:hypothetical protein
MKTLTCKKKLLGALLFISIIGIKSFASEGPIELNVPAGLFGVNEILKEVKTELTQKIIDLNKNFRLKHEKGNTNIFFTTDRNTYCSHKKFGPGDRISEVKISQVLNDKRDRLNEIYLYYPCSNQLSFKEVIQTKGMNLIPLSLDNFLAGRRDYSLSKDISSVYYRFLDGAENEIFSYKAFRRDNKLTYNFFVTGHHFLTLNLIKHETYTKTYFVLPRYRVDYQFTSRNFSRTYWHTEKQFQVIMPDDQDLPINYRSLAKGDISLASVQKGFQEQVLSKAVAKIKLIIGYHLGRFPNTESIDLGAAKPELLGELRQILLQVDDKNTFELGKTNLRNIIDDMDNFKIIVIDKRKK